MDAQEMRDKILKTISNGIKIEKIYDIQGEKYRHENFKIKIPLGIKLGISGFDNDENGTIVTCETTVLTDHIISNKTVEILNKEYEATQKRGG